MQSQLDYEGEKEKRDAGRKAGKKAKGALELQDVEPPPEARPEIHTATILASMRWKTMAAKGLHRKTFRMV